MNGRLSDRQVVLAVLASVGLVVVLCIGLVAVGLLVFLGDRAQQNVEATIDGVDRIAYVSADNELFIMDKEGGNVEYLAVGGVTAALAHPAWSPDGRRVAFIAQRETEQGVESILYTVSTAGESSTRLYASADHPAFYLYWSPNSQYVSFLTQEDTGLALRLAPADGSQDAQVLDRGAPFYWSWSPDSQEMLMHIGGARRFSEEARLAILTGQPESLPDVLDDVPTDFQAPAWSPDGDRLLYAGEDEDGQQALYIRQRESGAVEKLASVSGFLRFNWSPDGRWVAYQQVDDPRLAPLGHIYVVPVPGDGEQEAQAGGEKSGAQRVSRDMALAFFWSPDSQRLAILAPSVEEEGPSTRVGGLAAPVPQERRLLFRWWVADLPGGELQPLASFLPTRSFLLIVPYFDQYAQSIRFWSPDSRYLIYSHQESPQEAGIWVADVERQQPPRRLADGVLAVWSWQ
mgnify:CR=1 FL=1